MTVNVRRKRRYRILRTSHVPGDRRPVIISGEGRRLYTLLTAVTAAGMLAGALWGTGSPGLIQDRQWGFGVTFINSLAVLTVYIGLCFFGGLSAAGAPMAYLLCLFKGLGTGALCGCIFADGAGGILTAQAADIIPFEAMSIALVIFAAREDLRMSGIIYKRSFGGTSVSKDSSSDLKLYLKKFGVILLAAMSAALIDAVIGAF